jgi:hypothetical protein
MTLLANYWSRSSNCGRLAEQARWHCRLPKLVRGQQLPACADPGTSTACFSCPSGSSIKAKKARRPTAKSASSLAFEFPC